MMPSWMKPRARMFYEAMTLPWMKPWMKTFDEAMMQPWMTPWKRMSDEAMALDAAMYEATEYNLR